jgi:ABC-type sugar transport system substrate-binding protein
MTGRRLLTAVAAALLRLVPWTVAAQRVRRVGLNDEPLARHIHVVGVAPQRLEETWVLQVAHGLADRERLAR